MTCRQRTRKDRKYLDSFRGRACESCGRQDDTIVPAHNRRGHTGGMGLKPPDYLIAALCFDCHWKDTEGTPDERDWVWNNVLHRLMKDRYNDWLDRHG